jgi:hypothetical protein
MGGMVIITVYTVSNCVKHTNVHHFNMQKICSSGFQKVYWSCVLRIMLRIKSIFRYKEHYPFDVCNRVIVLYMT